jgi:hypothetical protein
MVVKVNKLWGRVVGITLWPFIFIRKEYADEQTINHEKIHIRQQAELLVIPFYVLYFIFWMRGVLVNSIRDPYMSIPFEKEAYANDDNPNYLKERKFWSWTRYVKKDS